MGAMAIAGTITVAIYHAIVTAGFNIYLLELLGLYFAAAVAVLACGPGLFSIDELIARRFDAPAADPNETLEALAAKTPAMTEVAATR